MSQRKCKPARFMTMIRMMMRTMMHAAMMLPLALHLSSNVAQAQNLVRDTETENFLQQLSQPVFDVANYPPGKIKFFIIGDKSLNAFVAGGDAIFVHTGLILAARSHEEITAVVAHEFGHILAGHVSQTLKGQEDAGKIALTTALASLVIGLGTNNIDAAIVGSLGGADTAQKSYLKGSRLRETAADQIAVDILNKAMLPLKYMVSFMSHLADAEQGTTNTVDVYSLTHPPSKDRLEFLQYQNEKSAYKHKSARPEFTEWHQRIKTKILAYDGRPSDVIARYDSDSDRDIYARAIAHYRARQYPQAFELLDILINKTKNNDGYLLELKGDFYLAIQQYDKAVTVYRQAQKILGKSPLIDYQIAVSLTDKLFAQLGNTKELTDQDKKAFKKAQFSAYRAVNGDEHIVSAWKLLSRIHNRLGESGKGDFALAEFYFRTGNFELADSLAQKSKGSVAEGSPTFVRAEDMLLQIDQILVEE